MKWVLVGLIAPLVWQFIGCCVLAAMDGPKGMNGRLLEWAKAAPLPGWGVAAMLWPYAVWKVTTVTVSGTP